MERKQVSIWCNLYSGKLYKKSKDWIPELDEFDSLKLLAICFEDEIDKVVEERKF